MVPTLLDLSVSASDAQGDREDWKMVGTALLGASLSVAAEAAMDTSLW